MKELTRAEEQVMQILWKLGKGFVKDILEQFEEPKPAYNTVSTVVRILEKKGFVGHRSFGKTHEYHPQMSKNEYKTQSLHRLVKNYFGDSYREMVSFLAKDTDVDIRELEEVMNIIRDQIAKQK